jgi:hypothetical protein
LKLTTLFSLVILTASCGKKPETPSRPTLPASNNGLSQSEREEWYHLSQGSELYPFRFLKALYLVDEQKPFAQNLERYGLIPTPKNETNTFEMPIGVTVGPTRDLSFAGVNMVGINCAACHTTVFEKNGTPVFLADGGQNLFDIDSFIGDLAGNTLKTLESPSEVFRFVWRLIQNNDLPDANTFGPRLLSMGGESVFRDAKSLDNLAGKGEMEKALADSIKTIYADQMQTPVRNLGDGLKVVPTSPKLSALAEKAKAAKTRFEPKLPDDVANEVHALRREYWGDFHAAAAPVAASIATKAPAAGSALAGLTVEARTISIRTALANVGETIALLRARLEFLTGLINGRSLAKTRPGPGRVDAFGSGAAKSTTWAPHTMHR